MLQAYRINNNGVRQMKREKTRPPPIFLEIDWRVLSFRSMLCDTDEWLTALFQTLRLLVSTHTASLPKTRIMEYGVSGLSLFVYEAYFSFTAFSSLL